MDKIKVPKFDLVSVLNKFSNDYCPNSLVRLREKSECASLLLKYFPPARDSVLEYYSQLISLKLKLNTVKQQIVPNQVIDEVSIIEIQTKIFGTIYDVLETNKEFWSEILCDWCLFLLSDISINTSIISTNRPVLTVQRTANKHLSCSLTKSLTDLLLKCITNLIHYRKLVYLHSFLDKCIEKSPFFDWILAHVGNWFPNLILNKIISHGLNDFTIHQDIIHGMRSDKFVSVVGIVGYLSIYHVDTVNTVIAKVFDWSLSNTNTKTDNESQKIVTLPFLLLLFSFNMNLCTSLMKNFSKSVSKHNLRKIINYSDQWIKYFDSFKMFKCWLLQVITNSKFGSIEVIKFLFDCYMFNDNVNFSTDELLNIKKYSWFFLENIMIILKKGHCNMLLSLSNHKDELLQFLFDPIPLKYETVARLLVILSTYHNSIIVEAGSILLRKSHSLTRLRLFVQIVTYSDSNWNMSDDLFAEILKAALKHTEVEYSCVFWNNLLTLLHYEYDKKLAQFPVNRIENGIVNSFLDIVNIFSKAIDTESECVKVIFILFYNLNISQNSNLCLTKLLNLADKLIVYFFSILCENGNEIEVEKLITIAKRIGINSRETNEYIIRELLYRVIFTSASHLFGYKQKKKLENVEKFLKKKHLDPKSDLISKCFRKYNQMLKLSDFDKGVNRKHLIKLLNVCSKIPNTKITANKKPAMFTRMVQNALIMVELLSPDVMYNGLPWPDEEFTKITMERDLTIYRMFNKYSVIWDIMNLIAINRPAACYCSVLFRGVIAILIRTWTSIGHQKILMLNNPKIVELIEMTVNILDLMNTGELIPRPFVYIRNIVKHLKPIEISYLLRDCIWNYMKDNVPSPILYSYNWNTIQWRDINAIVPKPIYTDTMTNCIQNNIEKLGSYYSYMFLFRN